MSIVLAILKWTGIAILGLLGLVLLLIVLVLFVPLRYYAAAEKNGDGFRYRYRLSWLLFIVMVKKKIDRDDVRLYLFGIPIRRLSGGKTETKSGDKKSSDEKPAENKSEENKPGDEKPERNRAEENKPERTLKIVKKSEGAEKPDGTEPAGEEPKSKKRKKRFSFKSVSSIIGFIRDADNRRVFGRPRGELWQLLRYLAPGSVRGRLRIGTGDPSLTGLLIGGISLLPFAYRKGVEILPEFEEKILEADGCMKGRIRLIRLIRTAVRLYRDKELKLLWKNINKKKEAA